MAPTKQDPCCYLCSTPSGVCASKYRCSHHIEVRREQDQADRGHSIGYSDPTGWKAVNNIMRAQKRKP